MLKQKLGLLKGNRNGAMAFCRCLNAPEMATRNSTFCTALTIWDIITGRE